LSVKTPWQCLRGAVQGSAKAPGRVAAAISAWSLGTLLGALRATERGSDRCRTGWSAADRSYELPYTPILLPFATSVSALLALVFGPGAEDRSALSFGVGPWDTREAY
jgi:hypothetical protein